VKRRRSIGVSLIERKQEFSVRDAAAELAAAQ
jgi:hypothetical protein